MNDITDHQDLNEKHDKLIVKYNQLERDLTAARDEIAALKAENERVPAEIAELRACIGTPEENERELAEEKRLLDRASEAEGIVKDLAEWGDQYKANHGLPILGSLGNIINRAHAAQSAKAQEGMDVKRD